MKAKPILSIVTLDPLEVNKDIRSRILQGTPFWHYLTEERLAENFGANEWERGIVEGARRFAGRLQDIVLNQGPED